MQSILRIWTFATERLCVRFHTAPLDEDELDLWKDLTLYEPPPPPPIPRVVRLSRHSSAPDSTVWRSDEEGSRSEQKKDSPRQPQKRGSPRQYYSSDDVSILFGLPWAEEVQQMQRTQPPDDASDEQKLLLEMEDSFSDRKTRVSCTESWTYSSFDSCDDICSNNGIMPSDDWDGASYSTANHKVNSVARRGEGKKGKKKRRPKSDVQSHGTFTTSASTWTASP